MCQKHDGQRYYSPDIDTELMNLHIPITVEMHIKDADMGCQNPYIEHQHQINFDFSPITSELEIDDRSNLEQWMRQRLPMLRKMMYGRYLRWHNSATHHFEFFMQVHTFYHNVA